MIIMGALTLNIRNLHSSMGTWNLIEIDETRLPDTIYDGTSKNKSSRILLLIIGWQIKSVFKRNIVFSNPLFILIIKYLFLDYTLQELKWLII